MHAAVLNPFDAAAILIVLTAILAYLNHRWLGLPSSVAMTIMGAVASLLVIAIDALLPLSDLSTLVSGFLSSIDFETTLMDGMLSFLLFAGALHVDWGDMKRGRWAIVTLSTIGVLISTWIVGSGFYFLTHLFGLSLSPTWCFVFGALISPTDPVAVMGVLKRAACAPTLQATVAGESLFNDGVGVVVFSILLAAALNAEPFTAASAAKSFAIEAGGGVVLGLVVGYVAFWAMRSIDEYNVELMITLAVVMGGYALGRWLHVSGPVAMAVAGLLIGNAGVALAMTEETRDHVLKFWALIDELLNAVLFLLLGLELIAMAPDPRLIIVGALAIPLVLAARGLSVVAPLAAIRLVVSTDRNALPILLWGGLRGGISLALALSLPAGPARTVILLTTYVVVLFSVIIQGISIGPFIKRFSPKGPCDPIDS